MGYQEYIIKVTDDNIQNTIDKINRLIKNSEVELLNVKATLKHDVLLYGLRTVKDDWTVKLHKNDTFLLLCGERYEGKIILNAIRNPSYPVDTVMRCAETSNYEIVFTDSPIEDLENGIDR